MSDEQQERHDIRARLYHISRWAGLLSSAWQAVNQVESESSDMQLLPLDVELALDDLLGVTGPLMELQLKFLWLVQEETERLLNEGSKT